MSNIAISERVFLNGWYDNVPIEGAWNQSVLDALFGLKEAIEKSGSDVEDLNLERWDKDTEGGLQGVVGFASKVPQGTVTDYFYVDFTAKRRGLGADVQAIDPKITQSLLQELGKYIHELEGYEFSKCIHDVGNSLDEVILRAFFVQLT